MTKYRYWVFYVNPDLLNDLSCIINEPNCIYAYTDNKRYAEIFEKRHDMSKFIKKKLLLTKEEVNALAHEERNQYLKKRNLRTHDKKGNKIEIECVLTMQEEKHLDLQVMSSLHNILYKIGVDAFPCRMLKDNIETVLEKFHFFTLVNNQVTDRGLVNIQNDCITILSNKRNTKIFADEISIYIHLFHNILNEKT